MGSTSETLMRIGHVQEHLVKVRYILHKVASKDEEHIITAHQLALFLSAPVHL